MPSSLHEDIAQAAAAEDVSLNLFICTTLSAGTTTPEMPESGEWLYSAADPPAMRRNVSARRLSRSAC
jgi:hypothetical protein